MKREREGEGGEWGGRRGRRSEGRSEGRRNVGEKEKTKKKKKNMTQSREQTREKKRKQKKNGKKKRKKEEKQIDGKKKKNEKGCLLWSPFLFKYRACAPLRLSQHQQSRNDYESYSFSHGGQNDYQRNSKIIFNLQFSQTKRYRENENAFRMGMVILKIRNYSRVW